MKFTGVTPPSFYLTIVAGCFAAACAFQLQSAFDDPGYALTVNETQRIFAGQLPFVPIFLRVNYAAARPDMCGYAIDPTSLSDFWNIETFAVVEGCR